jgi:hypothetical protein
MRCHLQVDAARSIHQLSRHAQVRGQVGILRLKDVDELIEAVGHAGTISDG